MRGTVMETNKQLTKHLWINHETKSNKNCKPKVHSQVHINVHMPLSKRLRDIYYMQKIDSQSLG